MEYSIIQVALVFIVTFVAAIDQFNFLESLYQPIVTGAVIGLILGDLNTGLLVGGTYQLMTIGNMPIGGAQPPNAVIGGIMAAILAIATGLEPNAAVGLAIPFALQGEETRSDAGGSGHLHEVLAHGVGRHVVVGDEDEVGAQSGVPLGGNLTMNQSVIDAGKKNVGFCHVDQLPFVIC